MEAVSSNAYVIHKQLSAANTLGMHFEPRIFTRLPPNCRIYPKIYSMLALRYTALCVS